MKSRPIILLGLALLIAAGPLSAAPKNILQSADFSALKAGKAPGKPWQTGAKAEGIEVVAGSPAGKESGWMHLRDASAEGAAALRQSFAPLAAGNFSAKIYLAKEHTATLGIYLGTGNASSPAERVIDLKTNAHGVVQIGTAGTREPTALKLEPGATTTLFVEWRPDAAGKQLEVSYGTLDEQGKPTDTQHLQMAVPIQAVSALRITSDKAPTGADFYVTNLQISPR